jgi:hypothetical protein
LLKFVHHDLEENCIVFNLSQTGGEFLKFEFENDAWDEPHLHFDVRSCAVRDPGTLRF